MRKKSKKIANNNEVEQSWVQTALAQNEWISLPQAHHEYVLLACLQTSNFFSRLAWVFFYESKDKWKNLKIKETIQHHWTLTTKLFSPPTYKLQFLIQWFLIYASWII